MKFEQSPDDHDPEDPTRAVVAREADPLGGGQVWLALLVPGLVALATWAVLRFLVSGVEEEMRRQIVVISGLTAAAGVLAWWFTGRRSSG